MTVRFGNYRLAFYVATFLLAGTVLGLSAHFAELFLPDLHRDFTIFSLIIPSLSIFVFLLTLQWATPWTEAIVLFILGTLWLAMGAWSMDIIGHIQCDGLTGQRTATKDGDMSAKEFCYEMKVIQAFSWMLFVLFVIAFYLLMSLVTEAQRFGRYDIWYSPIRELPWFGEAPGYYNMHPSGMMQYPPGAFAYPTMPMPMPGAPSSIVQSPGHQIVIQPGMNGQPPTITQQPL